MKFDWNTWETDGTLSDSEYFCNYGDLFDAIQSSHHDQILCGSLYQVNQMKKKSD